MTLQHASSSSCSSEGLAAILESDAAYFDAGAVIESINGAVIARMEGLEDLPSACVVHRIEPMKLPEDLNTWMSTVEERLKSHSIPLSRMYLHEAHEALEQVLRERGYQSRLEEAVAMKPEAGEPRFTLRPIVSDADWREKEAFHQVVDYSSDGHRSDPAQWVELERRKCDAGYMRASFIEEHGEVVGVVSSARVGDLLRAKNLLIHPDCRGRGIAAATIQDFARIAFEQGLSLVGAFRMAGESTAGFYHKAGCVTLGQQTEWTKELKT